MDRYLLVGPQLASLGGVADGFLLTLAKHRQDQLHGALGIHQFHVQVVPPILNLLRLPRGRPLGHRCLRNRGGPFI